MQIAPRVVLQVRAMYSLVKSAISHDERHYSLHRINNCKGVHLAHHRHLLISVISLTALAAQYTTVLMAQEKEKAFWTEPEVTALVDYLYEHWSEHAEGGNFKMSTFNGAAKAITPKILQGPQKTGKMCQTKWTSVHCIMLLIIDLS